MGSAIDLTGKRFGKLTVLKREGTTNDKQAKWLCLCDCGKTSTPSSGNLRSGATKTCGCGVKEQTIKRNFKHGKRRTRLYRIWMAIKNRCYNSNQVNWSWYGAKGVIVCSEWKDEFMSFYAWSMQNGYSDELELDRMDCCGNYSPDNCRWITHKENCNNRREKG